MGSSLGGRESPSTQRRPEESGTKPSAKRGGAAYQGTLEAVFAVPVGVGIGYFVDRYFESFPTFLLIGAVIGFAAFALRLWRLGRDLQEPGKSDGGTERNR